MRKTNSGSELLYRFCADESDPLPPPSALIIVAHPDDEVIGAGGRLTRLRNARFIHLTDGSPLNLKDAFEAGFHSRVSYAEARRRELGRALSLAGITPAQCKEMGIVDQELSYQLEPAVLVLKEMVAEMRPEVIATLPYEGGHPDHDAAAFVVHAACAVLKEGMTQPAIIEMTSYHSGNGGMNTFEFLGGDSGVVTVALSERLKKMKMQMISSFVSQQKVLSAFPVELERFRIAPEYDFTQPPHAGALYYESQDWGIDGPNWRSLAKAALKKLKLKAPL